MLGDVHRFGRYRERRARRLLRHADVDQRHLIDAPPCHCTIRREPGGELAPDHSVRTGDENTRHSDHPPSMMLMVPVVNADSSDAR